MHMEQVDERYIEEDDVWDIKNVMTYDHSYHYSKIRELRDSYGADLIEMLV